MTTGSQKFQNSRNRVFRLSSHKYRRNYGWRRVKVACRRVLESVLMHFIEENHDILLLLMECRFAGISDDEMSGFGDVARSSWSRL